MANYSLVIQDSVQVTELVREVFYQSGGNVLYQARMTIPEDLSIITRMYTIPINTKATQHSTSALQSLPTVNRMQIQDICTLGAAGDTTSILMNVDAESGYGGTGSEFGGDGIGQHICLMDGAARPIDGSSTPRSGTYYPDDGPTAFADTFSGNISNDNYTITLFAGDGINGVALTTILLRFDLGGNINFSGDDDGGAPFGNGSTEELGPYINITDSVLVQDAIQTTFRDYSVGIIPTIDVYSWDTTQTSPIGQRHIPSGSFAWKDYINTKGYLDFGVNDQTTHLTGTECITFKIHKQIIPFGVTNCKLWISQASGVGTYPSQISVNGLISNNWIRNIALPSGSGVVLATSVPTNQNIFRSDSSPYIDGGTLDQYNFPDMDINTSQFMYVSINHNPAVQQDGDYGFGGAGSLKLRITYDYFAYGYYWKYRW